MAPRSSVVTVLFLLLTTVSSRALQPDGPTANECRDHIDAAIKNYLSGQEDGPPESLASPEIYTRAQSDHGFEDENDQEVVSTTGLDDDDHRETEEGVESEDTTTEESESDTTKHDEKRDVDGDDEDDGADCDDEDSEKHEEASEQGEEEEDDEAGEGERRVERDAQTDEETNDVVEEHAQEQDDDDDDDEATDKVEEKQVEQEKEGEAEEEGEKEEKVDEDASEEHDDDDGDEIENQVEAPPTEDEHFQSASEDTDDDDEEGDEHQTPPAGDDQGSEEDEEEGEEDKNRVERHAEEDDTDQDEAEDAADQEDDHADTEEEPSTDGSAASSEGQTADDSAHEQPSPADEDDEADDKDAGESAGEEHEASEGEAEGEDEEEEPIEEGPGQLRTRENLETILRLGEDNAEDNKEREKIGNDILKEIKRMYEGAVRPLETLYKFKDISTRQMGDAEIFSKPMVLFIGPWSTGKSAIINYLLGTEYSRYALKTGAEPTSNSFNVIMYGDSDQVLDGTQLAADWAFSTLQKFGQTFLDRLRGRKMSNPLLQKMTIVDSPGILENRKSTERQYPFNDAFQWFIDRADLIYIVFDPTKLDIGMELEAIFDQLKGRENQVRILLNKADTVKPQELMKVQGTLLWNLSPLLGTSEAPTVYVGSFWSRPYLPGSPETLLDAQEEAFLDDLHDALANRVENKVALSRRHAVRVRNHAKMVDCYLTTYYNHKSFFSNKRKVADDIVENPQNYHIYEGLSILTNVSRYDLPDPDIYREFFRIHPLFDFKPLASTCSYFKGCPLDKLDIAIAYDLPELVGKYQRLMGNRAVVGGR